MTTCGGWKDSPKALQRPEQGQRPGDTVIFTSVVDERGMA